jgi:hypothetical protein
MIACRPSARARERGAQLAVCFLVALVAAGFSETYAAWQTAVLGIGAFAARLVPLGRRWWEPMAGAMAGSILGAMIVALAPGNAVRSAGEGDKLAPLASVEIAPRALSEALDFALRRFSDPAVLLAATIVGVLTIVTYSGLRPTTRRLAAGALLVVAVAELVIAVTWLPALVALHGSPPPRAMAPAAFTIVAAAVALGILGGLLVLSFIERIPGPRYWQLPAAGVAIAIASTLVVRLIVLGEIRQSGELENLARAWDARNLALASAKTSGASMATVAVIRGVATLEDVTPDPAHWLNGCVASYYGLTAVVAR